MLQSAATLAATQTGRAGSLPGQLIETPLRSTLLEGLRWRNTRLDAMFYDVSRITVDEALLIAPHLAAEGAILLVPPTGAGGLSLHRSIDDFAAAAPAVTALAVAGVGSSALGTAAFARNIADAIGQPVAGVVSGYGLADVMAEAMGGYFWFGQLNGLRHGFEALDRLSEAGHVAEPLPWASGIGGLAQQAARQSRDTRAVMALLDHPTLRFDLLTGHSKGNLVISEALYALRDAGSPNLADLAERARIVTVSARIRMPRLFAKVIDIMGDWDWFGGLNSRASIAPDLLVAGAWHHTNTELFAHLPVTANVKHALTMA